MDEKVGDQPASTMESEGAGTSDADLENQVEEQQISELEAASESESNDPESESGNEGAPGMETEQVEAESEGGDGAAEPMDDQEGEKSELETIDVSVEEAAPLGEGDGDVDQETPGDEPSEDSLATVEAQEPAIESTEATDEDAAEPTESEIAGIEESAEEVATDESTNAATDESEQDASLADRAPTDDSQTTSEEDVLAEAQPSDAPTNGKENQAPAEVVAESETKAPALEVTEPDDDRQWYVVHCYSGYENKVRHNLEQRIETMDMKGKIFDVVVPTEEEIEVRNGKRRTVERRVFPGYILVQMIMDEDSWYVVRNTPGVTGFVGMGNDPTPLRPEEVSQIVKRMEAEAPRIKVTFDVGQKVRIIDGPFNDFIGTVDDIDMDKGKVRVMVSFFGRDTPVELDFLQVEKA